MARDFLYATPDKAFGESNVTEGRETPYLLRAVGDAKEVFPLELNVRPDGTVSVGGGANSKCPVAFHH